MQEQTFAIFLKTLIFENPPNKNAKAATVLHTFLNIFLPPIYFVSLFYHLFTKRFVAKSRKFLCRNFRKYVHFSNLICNYQIYVAEPKEFETATQRIRVTDIKII